MEAAQLIARSSPAGRLETSLGTHRSTGAVRRKECSRHQDGFEPCKWEDYPEVTRALLATGPQTGNIEIGGLMLCRAPVEMVDQRNTHYLKQANDWMKSVDSNFMRENDPRMPLFNDRRTEVQFGKR
jgi:hypothetical protein